jgi:hypothetical protein
VGPKIMHSVDFTSIGALYDHLLSKILKILCVKVAASLVPTS